VESMNNTVDSNEKHIQSFSRYEFKYILKKSLSDKIENESKYFMQRDSHTNKDLGNRYFVRSLYFDNQFSSNFFEKVINHRINNPTGLRSESNKLKLLHADTLFIHSTPNPSSDSETCCLGERNFECFPVPIISKSSDS